MPKKKLKRFDVWVTRDHGAIWNNQIESADAFTTTVTRDDGCCYFNYHGRGKNGREQLTVEECLERYGFLPRPGQCWNVWIDGQGKRQYRYYPILEKDNGTLYREVTIKAEAQYYL